MAVVDFQPGERLSLVGNCAFRRHVLERVYGFDPELGPGALGLGEDTLFGLQLTEAGYKIEYAKNALVVHFPDKSRLFVASGLNQRSAVAVREHMLCITGNTKKY